MIVLALEYEMIFCCVIPVVGALIPFLSIAADNTNEGLPESM